MHQEDRETQHHQTVYFLVALFEGELITLAFILINVPYKDIKPSGRFIWHFSHGDEGFLCLLYGHGHIRKFAVVIK